MILQGKNPLLRTPTPCTTQKYLQGTQSDKTWFKRWPQVITNTILLTTNQIMNKTDTEASPPEKKDKNISMNSEKCQDF
jgi:hypothetical protein